MNGASYEWAMRVRDFDLANRGGREEREWDAPWNDPKLLLAMVRGIVADPWYDALHSEATVLGRFLRWISIPPPGLAAPELAEHRRYAVGWAERIAAKADAIDAGLAEMGIGRRVAERVRQVPR